jgi:Phage terminase, small subunit
MKKTPELTVIEADANGTSTRRKPDTRGAKLKQSILTEYGLDDPANAELLEQICSAIDRLDAVAQRIARDGVMLRGQRGQRPHPLLKIEATLRGFVVRSLAKLGVAP